MSDTGAGHGDIADDRAGTAVDDDGGVHGPADPTTRISSDTGDTDRDLD